MSTDPTDPRFEEWDVADDEDAAFVGATAPGSQPDVVDPVYYLERERTFFRAELDAENEQLVRLPDQQWELEPEETLAEGIERLGEELGWESLSEWAESELESGDG